MTNFRTFKDFHGNYKAVTIYPMDKSMQLEIVTVKRSSGELVTSVTAMRVVGDNVVQYYPFDDFHKVLQRNRLKRCTEKAIAEQHKTVLENNPISQIVEECNRHYQKSA